MAEKIYKLFYADGGQKTSQDLVSNAKEIVVEKIQVKDATGLITFEVMPTGTVKHGKSKVEQEEIAQGIILRSANGNRWKIQVSDTGQVVTTNLGV